MRGEYDLSLRKPHQQGELPPRARRIRGLLHQAKTAVGTTSACAENTWAFAPGQNSSWNYLRVRGEYAQRLLAIP
ncbi:hypothetical protein HMPREF0299_5952 [Corynebacterium matruchotii ATCC 14266]|uniref:Uncharacterized protein n=1 Tax=Corynebacterium matruchotii ATCC 14266 TaxID=553207 RepID=E0DCA3_9CORY|nr:hypothetical protein HMPREF0299_5952 [Corynebacterium matruchotii ATCC 14266]